MLACILCQIHTDEDSPYFCRTCKTVVCTLCIIEEHGEHDVAKIEVAYKQQQEVANDLKQIICDKAKHKRVVKADFEAVHSSIIRSCEQVCGLSSSKYLALFKKEFQKNVVVYDVIGLWCSNTACGSGMIQQMSLTFYFMSTDYKHTPH